MGGGSYQWRAFSRSNRRNATQVSLLDKVFTKVSFDFWGSYASTEISRASKTDNVVVIENSLAHLLQSSEFHQHK